jgi:hypothetical protein
MRGRCSSLRGLESGAVPGSAFLLRMPEVRGGAVVPGVDGRVGGGGEQGAAEQMRREEEEKKKPGKDLGRGGL